SRGNMVDTGLQNSFSHNVKRTPTNRNTRINMNTALTIAKKKPNLNHQQTEVKKLQKESNRSLRSTMEHTRKVKLDYTQSKLDYTQNISSQHTRLTPSL